MRRSFLSAMIAATLFGAAASWVPAGGQTPAEIDRHVTLGPGSIDARSPTSVGRADAVTDVEAAINRTRQARLMAEAIRQKNESDAVRLVALTTTLQSEVNRSSTPASLPDLAAKLQEIEKLAHKLKSRMKS